MTSWTLRRHPEPHAVVRLAVGTDVPAWATSATLMSITVTGTETTVVCAASAAPRKARPEGPYTPFEVVGPLDLALTGVLAALLEPLAAAEVPVYVVSTIATDWVLVPSASADTAAQVWQSAGHTVEVVPTSTRRSPS